MCHTLSVDLNRLLFSQKNVVCFIFNIFFFEDFICSTPEEIHCSEESRFSMNKCLKPCSGLSLTSFVKYEPTNVFEKNYASTIDQYKTYKKIFWMDEDYKSNDRYIVENK